MPRTLTRQQAAHRFLKINHWLANRYAQTDKHGRRWLAMKRNNGQPSKYTRLNRAFLARYSQTAIDASWHSNFAQLAERYDDPLRLTE